MVRLQDMHMLTDIERAAFDWTVEVSIYVDEKFKKHGIGRKTLYQS